MRVLFLYGVLLFLPMLVLAVEGSDDEAHPDSLFHKYLTQDTTYIDNLEDKLSIKLFSLNRTNNFTITDAQNTFESNYEPNVGSDLGLGLVYKWLKVGLAFARISKDGPENTHGVTRRFDLQGHLFTKKLGADVSVQLYNGFYLSNPAAFDKNWKPGNPLPQRSDITTLSLGAYGYYVFNHEKFSLQSVYVQSEWQKKSAGSFFLGTSINTFGIIADSAIAPKNFSNPTNRASFFEDARFRSVAPLLGYSYTLVLNEHIFTNLTLSPGFAFANTRIINAEGELAYRNNHIIGTMGMRFGLGYNSRKFFGGFSAEYNWQQFRFNKNQGRFGFTRGQARFYVGYRFDWS